MSELVSWWQITVHGRHLVVAIFTSLTFWQLMEVSPFLFVTTFLQWRVPLSHFWTKMRLLALFMWKKRKVLTKSNSYKLCHILHLWYQKFSGNNMTTCDVNFDDIPAAPQSIDTYSSYKAHHRLCTKGISTEILKHRKNPRRGINSPPSPRSHLQGWIRLSLK